MPKKVYKAEQEEKPARLLHCAIVMTGAGYAELLHPPEDVPNAYPIR